MVLPVSHCIVLDGRFCIIEGTLRYGALPPQNLTNTRVVSEKVYEYGWLDPCQLFEQKLLKRLQINVDLYRYITQSRQSVRNT